MNLLIKKNKEQERREMRILGLALMMIFVAACAYDPMMEEGEFQNLSGDQGIDFVVSDKMILTSSQPKIKRLIFMENSVLSTEGADLNLVVDEIISHNGTIRTKASGSPATLGSDGVSGGMLRIQAKKARGHLSIIAEGQSGATGMTGAAGLHGSQGSKGHSASVSRQRACPFMLDTKFLREGPGPIDRCYWESYCSRETGDGARGAQGSQGDTGGVGGRGGDSATVMVEIEDPSLVTIATESIAGSGGMGGEGGVGGQGGPGGDAGDRDKGKVCRIAQLGPEGFVGPSGNTGSQGANGERKPICLVLGSAQIGDCKQFKDLTQSEVNW